MSYSESEELQTRWYVKTGEKMPDEISSQPIEILRRAVDLCESGATVFIEPRVPVKRPVVIDESLSDLDTQDAKNGNAYSS